MAYIITATIEDNNGVRVDSNQPEFLGDAYGREYESREDALAFALQLQSEVHEYDLPASLIYAVEAE